MYHYSHHPNVHILNEKYKKKVRKRIAKIEKRLAARKSSDSVMQIAIRLNPVQKLQDVRHTFGDLEEFSGLPFYKSYYDIIQASNVKDEKIAMHMKNLLKDLPKEAITEEEQTNVTEYFTAIYLGKPMIKLTHKEATLARNIKNIMNEIKPFVKKYRFLSWVESKLNLENGGLGEHDMKGVSQATLEEGFEIMQEGASIDEWLDEQKFGVIEEGYIPRAFLSEAVRFKAGNVDSFSKRAIKTRISSKEESDIHLLTRVRRYIQNITNMEYLGKPLKELDTMLFTLGVNMDKTTLAGINHWVDKVKGYKQETIGLDQMLRVVRRAFSRSLTVSPKLWARNMFQRFITAPFKKPLLSKSMFANLGSLPDSATKYFYLHTDQLEAMKKEFLYYIANDPTMISNHPLLKNAANFTEFVGSGYALSDFSNRASVFAKTYKYIEPYINSFEKGNIPLQKLLNNSGYLAMKSYEQKYFLELLKKSPQEALLWASDWNVKNSQWVYKMKERSLDEVSTKMPSFFNLFVWPRSFAALVARHVDNTLGSAKSFQERKAGAMGLASLYIAMEVGKGLFSLAMGVTKKKRYESYDFVSSFFWPLGGGVVSIVNDYVVALKGVIWAYQNGTDKDKKYYMAIFLKVNDRSANALVPFAKEVFTLLEAVSGRTYISPLHDWYRVASEDYKKLSRREKEKLFGMTDRTFVQKIQHAIGRSVRESKEETAKRVRKEIREGTHRTSLSEKLLNTFSGENTGRRTHTTSTRRKPRKSSSSNRYIVH